MPDHLTITKELATVLKVLGHPDRLRIVEALRAQAVDVNALCQSLNLPQTRISQHLALMRQNQLVREERKGRQVFYTLTQTGLAHWITDGLQFIETRANAFKSQDNSLRKTRLDETLPFTKNTVSL